MTHTPNFLHAGINAARNNDKQIAREQLRRHIEVEPLSEIAWLWMVSVSETAEERYACVARVLEINPANERAGEWLAPARDGFVQDLLTRGVAAAKSGDAEAAYTLLQRSIELDSTKELAWLWLASVSISPAEKLAHLERVLEINPANGHALTGIKHTRSQLARSLVQQAQIAIKGGARSGARERLREAVVQDANLEEAWLILAQVSDDLEEQANHLRRALEINPASTLARQALDAVEAQLAQPAWTCPLCTAEADAPVEVCAACEARLKIDDAEAFISAQPTDNSTLRGALARLRQPFETNDANAQDCFQLGLALLNLGDWNEGIEYLRTALRLDPQDERLAANINNLVALREQHQRQQAVESENHRAIEMRENVLPDFATADFTTTELTAKRAADKDATDAWALETFAPVEIKPAADDPLDVAPANAAFVPQQQQQQNDSAQLTTFEGAANPSVGSTFALPAAEPSLASLLPMAKEKTPANRTIMIVDDSPTIRKLVTIKLEKQGHRVIPAEDGMAALALLNDEVPDLVLLDITMPRLDGYQLCKLIRQNAAMKNLPVIMLSGKDGFFDKVRGRMAGSTAYITKPFEPETLLKIVAEHTS